MAFIRWKALLIVSLICVCGVARTIAQENGFLFRDIGLSEEFDDRIITLTEKDHAGLLWFVTNDGLYRYDGNETIRFDRNSNPAISHSTITDILADSRDNLWIAGLDGLTRFDLKAWNAVRVKVAAARNPGIREVNIQSLGEGIDGRIYAGTRDGKLYRVANDSLELVTDIAEPFHGQFRLAAIYTITEPYPGELWLATEIGKMIRIRVTGDRFSQPEYFGLPEFEGWGIRDVYFHPSGKSLLNVPQHGLYVFDTHAGTMERLSPAGAKDLGKNGVAFFAPFGRDSTLIFTNRADIGKEKLFVYDFVKDTTTMRLISYPEYMNDNHIDWFENKGNTLLMSLNNLIVQLVPAKHLFKTMLTDAVAINSIRSIYKHPGGRLYVGSYKDRFLSIDEKTGEKIAESNQFVYDILHWNADTLLLSTEGDGLFWYEMNKRKLTPLVLHPARSGLHPPQTYMTTLTRAGRESVWVGTYTGLLLVNPYTHTYEPIKDDVLVQTKILSTVENNGKLWIGTPTGLAEWDKDTDTLHYRISDSPVYCIIRVGAEFWLGTEGKGILILDSDGRIKDTIDNSGGLTNNTVYGLVSEGQHVVAATQNGMSIINRKTKRIRNYSRLDQLPASEFNHRAVFHAGDTVYLGTINGLVRFSVANESTLLNEVSPKDIPLAVTRLTTERSGTGTQHHYAFPYLKENGIVIEASTRYFSIGFGGWSEYTEGLQYFYRLDSQTDWYPLGNRQEIAFVETPPGDYRLELMAQLPDGQQAGAMLQVPLVVKPAFHQTVWFKALVLLAIGLLIWSVFRYREHVMRKEKKMRVKIASDLHDEVGSSLTRIYFQADSLSVKPYPGDGKQLQQIADTSKEALLTMSDMVWSIDSRFDTVKDLVIRMKDYVYKLREELDAVYRFDIHGDYTSRPVSQIIRQNLFLIFKEALTNAIKYGDGSEITIELALERAIRLRVTNRYATGDGRIADQQGGRGMQSMQQRAAKMGGQLSCTAEDGVFQLTLIVT